MPTLGEILRNTRISKNLTLSQVKKATHIREHVLIAMENDDLGIFHSPAQLRGFIKHYAEFLGLDPIALIRDHLNKPELTPNSLPEEETPSNRSEELPEENTLPEAENQSETPKPHDHLLIYQQIAQIFRERRTALNLTLDEVEYYSHIRKRNVELIERAEFDSFGSTVQFKGLLSTYTDFLELDREYVLTLFAEALLAKRNDNLETPTSISPNPSPIRLPIWLRQFISPDLLFGASMVLILLILGLWGAYTIISTANDKTDQNPSISDVLHEGNVTEPAATEQLVTSSPEDILVTRLPGEGETATALPTTENLMAVNVTLVINERTLVRVTVDGEIVLNKRTLPGTVLDFHGEKNIEIFSGSGSAVKVIYNSQELGLMGEKDRSAFLIVNDKTVITPTPSITPSPTITLTPTRTLIPTKTKAP